MRSGATIFAATLAMCGCGDDVAREYAKQLAATLNAYQLKMGEQIQAQQKAYEKIARILEVSSEQDLLGGLDTERLEMVTELRDRVQSTGPRTRLAVDATGLREALLRYARRDFQIHQETATQELDTYKRFLAGIADLQQDQANMKTLAKLLSDLSEKHGAVDRVKELAAFGKGVRTNLGKIECDGLAARKADLQDAIKELASDKGEAAEQAKKVAEEQVAELTKQRTSKKCAGA